MQRLSVFALSLAAVITVESAFAQTESVSGRPSEAPYAPATAASYIARIVVEQSTFPAREERTITRLGPWIRDDRFFQGKQSIIFSDIRTGTSYSVEPLQTGYRSLSITRSYSTESPFTRTKLGQRDNVLGEECEIWSILPAPIEHTECVTLDGIPLWSRMNFFNDAPLHSEQTISLERRESPLPYVRPPNELFNWSYWVRKGEKDNANSKALPDIEVTLTSADGNQTQTIRRHWPWTYVNTARLDGTHSLSIRSPAVQLDYDDQRRSLWVRLSDAHGQLIPGNIYDLLSAGVAPIAISVPPERVAGETCTWFDVEPSVADAGRGECRTRDGIPLHIRTWYIGTITSELTATRISRRPLPLQAVTPPRSVFDWQR
jgi:hypothetical protein